MTWILPTQLHTSACALDTEALTLDLNEQSQVCAQSLLVRSKPSPARTWSLKWKRDSWTQHLSGRILKPSLGTAFAAKWTSSLAATPASHSPAPASDLGPKTPDICGRSSQMELPGCDPESASSRMSRDTSPSDCERSLQNWKASVIEQRGEYSARLKSALRIRESGSSSWPTATSRDYKDGTAESCMNVPVNCLLGQAAQANPSTHGSRQELWATPRSGKTTDENPESWAKRHEAGNVATMPLTAQVKSWATPCSRDHHPNGSAVGSKTDLGNQVQWATPRAGNPGSRQPGTGGAVLAEQAKSWATPRVCSAIAATITPEAANNPKRFPNLETQVGQMISMKSLTQCGKLNPRWVETLMGLPVGWTMPSCASPATIAPTNCDSSATELSQPPQNEPSKF